MFAFDGRSWNQEITLIADGGAFNELLGFSVSLSDDRALVGAAEFSGFPGSAYVFSLGLGAPFVADADPDQTVVTGQTATRNGSGSSGEGPPSFAWTLTGASPRGASPSSSGGHGAAGGRLAARGEAPLRRVSSARPQPDAPHGEVHQEPPHEQVPAARAAGGEPGVAHARPRAPREPDGP